MDQHLLTHLANKKLVCDHCGQFFRQKVFLETHMKTCSRLNIKEENCGVEKFGSRTELDTHKESHEEEGIESYSCKICNVGFRSYEGYMRHGINVHNAKSYDHFVSIQEIISSRKSKK